MMRRERRYCERLSINLTPETMRSLIAASERYGISKAVLARRAVEKGWPATRDALRRPPRRDGGGK